MIECILYSGINIDCFLFSTLYFRFPEKKYIQQKFHHNLVNSFWIKNLYRKQYSKRKQQKIQSCLMSERKPKQKPWSTNSKNAKHSWFIFHIACLLKFEICGCFSKWNLCLVTLKSNRITESRNECEIGYVTA